MGVGYAVAMSFIATPACNELRYRSFGRLASELRGSQRYPSFPIASKIIAEATVTAVSVRNILIPMPQRLKP